MISRRGFLGRAAALAALASGSARGAEFVLGPGDPARTSSLRVLRARHRTLLVEVGGRRALLDPCFAGDLGAPLLWSAPAPALEPEGMGEVDLLLVSSSEAGAFDARSVSRLHGRRAACLVPDDRTASLLRYAGFVRVRTVAAGDVVEHAGITVRVSPSRGLFGGRAVGFHLDAGGRRIWHAGAPPPLQDAEVAEDVVAFARSTPADVLAVSAAGLRVGGVARTLDREDALLLAGLCRARYAFLLDEGVSPSPIGGWLVQSRPGRAAPPPGPPVRAVAVEPGRWYRVGAT